MMKIPLLLLLLLIIVIFTKSYQNATYKQINKSVYTTYVS